jgi:putative transposase
VKKRYEVREEYDDVLAIDMGARWIATSVALSTRETTFHGENVRRIREHYSNNQK